MLDLTIVQAVANELGTNPSLIEKDWHVVRALSVLAELDHGVAQPAFSGGTSLSKGWQLIDRFSEDIDFKITVPEGTTRTVRSAYRKMIVTALESAGFVVINEKTIVGNDSKFFSFSFNYQSEFPQGGGLRPHLQVEMTFDTPTLPPIQRPLQSFVAQAMNKPSEVAAFACINPVETAADKLSALAWRTCVRDRHSEKDDPTIVRHLHDLAALEKMVNDYPDFGALLHAKAIVDSSRGDVPAEPSARFEMMLKILNSDSLWEQEYDNFVRQVSFANEVISFKDALKATTRLVEKYSTG